MSKPGISKLYGYMLENLANRKCNLTLKAVKEICDILYTYITTNADEIEVMINEYKAISKTDVE